MYPDICSICFDCITYDKIILSCKHVIHFTCIYDYLLYLLKKDFISLNCPSQNLY